MTKMLAQTWALMLGMYLLMIGNGVQGTLLGVRGGIEDFSTSQMSFIMSAYFVGFLGGSRTAPAMIRRVGHVRVFAALASTVSAVFILYPLALHPIAWIGLRIIIGFCFSGVYVTAESWLNNSVSNAQRGTALSLYMIVQMGGIVTAQLLLAQGDAGGFILFIVPSILVSLSFAPILLSVQPTPAFDATTPMSLRKLIQTSPLTAVGMVLLGVVYSTQFSMMAVWGAEAGLTIAQISFLVSVTYSAALIAQFPIGFLSDRFDRRIIVMCCAIISGSAALYCTFQGSYFKTIVIGAGIMGATANPIYALLLAYANDYLEHSDMAAASSGYVFIHGIGAILGPISAGVILTLVGPSGMWALFATVLFALAGYAAYRMTQRPSADREAVPYLPVSASASMVAVEMVQEEYIAREIEGELDEKQQNDI